MNSARFRGLAAVIAMASVTAVAACSSSNGSSDSSSGGDAVSIKVEGWRPGDKQPTIDAVKAQAAAFNKANPGIVVEPVEWEWKAETFAAQLAGNQLPTTFRVPFTDTKGLAERKQIADVTDLVNKLPYADKFNPNVLAAAKGPDGRIYGIPTEAYGVGLHYNRDLFKQAGLDPRQAADVVGRGARRRQADRRQDRPGRLRPDDQGQHRRLDAHDPHLQPGWSHGADLG